MTPQELAQRAVDSMTLLGPDIRTSVGVDGHALVGVPVWLWTPAGAQTWGPTSATASVPGLSVTATARARSIRWELGDGTTVTCDGPGTPFDPQGGRVESPDCGHVYERSSARSEGAVYPLTATTTWDVTWAGGGDSGALVLTRTSSATLSVAELEVLVR